MNLSMLLPAVLFGLVTAGGAVPTEQETSRADPLFPTATEGMTFAGGVTRKERQSLYDMLQAVVEKTGWNVTMSLETESALSNTWLMLMRDVEVPAEEVFPFTCALLDANRFTISVVKGEEPTLFEIQALDSMQGRNARTNATVVERSELEDFARYPGFMVTTTIDLRHLDVRTLSNSMRAMITDPNTMSIIPVGASHSLILTGFATELAPLVSMLEVVDAREAKRQAEAPPAPDAKEAGR